MCLLSVGFRGGSLILRTIILFHKIDRIDRITQDLQDACILNKNILLILEILSILYYL